MRIWVGTKRMLEKRLHHSGTDEKKDGVLSNRVASADASAFADADVLAARSAARMQRSVSGALGVLRVSVVN